MCSHVVGLLKQLIHYVTMKVKTVRVDLICTQMQQTWHKPWPSQIEAEPVMNVAFRRARQNQRNPKRDPIVYTLYEARAQAMQEYSIKQQHELRMGLFKCQPQCAFAHTLKLISEEHITTLFGRVPRGSVLSYQLSDNEKAAVLKPKPSLHQHLPPLPLTAISMTPSMPSDIGCDQQTCLDKLRVTLDGAHELDGTKHSTTISVCEVANKQSR